MIHDEECKGCSMNHHCIIEPSYTDPKTNEVIKCPCIDCIIKTMCNFTCEKYEKYEEYIIKNMEKELVMVHSEEECRGCYVFDCTLIPSYIDPETNKTIECPCRKCLVKSMCDYGSGCKEYEEYRDYVDNMDKTFGIQGK